MWGGCATNGIGDGGDCTTEGIAEIEVLVSPLTMPSPPSPGKVLSWKRVFTFLYFLPLFLFLRSTLLALNKTHFKRWLTLHIKYSYHKAFL